AEVFLQFAPISFDASTLELWGALVNGGRLVVFPAYTPTLRELGAVLERHRVTTLWLTAGLFHQMVDENPAGLSRVRQLLAGGDVLSARHVRRVLDELPACTVINGYGPTENTTFTCCRPMRAAAEVGEPVPIGRPIANTRVWVLDRRLRPVPVGVFGELCTGGDGLARGYLNRPRRTAESFVPSPVGEQPGARLYRTGDVVRFLADGRIEFLGRRDFQVKVRGFRIELGEVEAALGRHPAVREAVVVAAGQRLIAYLVTREPAGAGELKDFLRRTLPEYMVPSAVVSLEALPLGPTGKVDRAALPAPEPGGIETAERFVAPRNQVEEVLAGIWAEVLAEAGGRIGVYDDFFALGGHSLLATRIVSRIRLAFSVELPLLALFEASTLAALAPRVEQAMRAGREPAPPIERRSRDGELPLSFAQERLWFLDRYEPDSPVYNIPAVYELTGRLDPAALTGSLRAVVRRHESLRTTFREGPCQHLAAELEVKLPLVDLRGLPAATRPAAAAVLAEQEARRPFDLAVGPLLRAALLRLGDEQHRLLLTLHHIISDGWSMDLLAAELATFYQALCAARPPRASELPIQYADFACWQRRWLRGAVLEEQLAYWRGKLEGAPGVLELPTDRPRPPAQSHRGAALARALPAVLGDRLKALSQRQGATLFMTALAAFAALLHRYTGQQDLLVGSPVANRGRTELEGLIGMFVNTLVLRAELDADLCFRELLERVRETALGAYVHQDLPFERLVEELEPERDLSRSPLFQVMFALDRGREKELESGLPMRPLGVDTRTSKFDLTVQLLDVECELLAGVTYNVDLFDRVTIERLLAHLERLLEAIADAPEERLSALPLLAAAEEHALLREWNDTATGDRSDRSVHELFELQVARRPEALAAADRKGMLSYGELGRRADRLARRLRRHGVGPEVVVAIFMERSAAMLVAMLGILKAGGAYLPIDPSYPGERLSFMLADSGAPVVLTQEELAATVRGALPEPAPGVMVVDGARSGEFGNGNGNGIGNGGGNGIGNGQSGPGNLAYVIYTSGSTGRPKGVEIRHSGLVNLVRWHQRTYGVTPADRATQVAGLSFDASVREIWPYLTAGASLHLPDQETRSTPSKLVSWLAAEAVTIGFQPTPMAEALLAEPWPPRTALRA
ncbi:MAG: AMP-binding protein, partial [bacterium]|nr:AMP-binding protein [bacterium]